METCTGLTTAEAQQRLARFGPNAVVEKKPRTWLLFLHKFWAPVPWMLELTLILEGILAKWPAALIIALLLIFNAVLGFSQERKAQGALELLKQRLRITARVCRDGKWQSVSAAELVPGDLVHVRVGDIVRRPLRRSPFCGSSEPIDPPESARRTTGDPPARCRRPAHAPDPPPRTLCHCPSQRGKPAHESAVAPWALSR